MEASHGITAEPMVHLQGVQETTLECATALREVTTDAAIRATSPHVTTTTASMVHRMATARLATITAIAAHVPQPLLPATAAHQVSVRLEEAAATQHLLRLRLQEIRSLPATAHLAHARSATAAAHQAHARSVVEADRQAHARSEVAAAHLAHARSATAAAHQAHARSVVAAAHLAHARLVVEAGRQARARLVGAQTAAATSEAEDNIPTTFRDCYHSYTYRIKSKSKKGAISDSVYRVGMAPTLNQTELVQPTRRYFYSRIILTSAFIIFGISFIGLPKCTL